MKNFNKVKQTDLYQKFVVSIASMEVFSAGKVPCAVAVSGGGDSMALVLLLAAYLGPDVVTALHFDHALRAESGREAAWLSSELSAWGLPLVIQRWSQEGGVVELESLGNIQQSARRARYDFFAQICAKKNMPFICVAHNQDDIAETFLMRVARGSGLKGLACLEEDVVLQNVRVVRPLLPYSRAEIRAFLQEIEQECIDDPSNENDKFFRVRVRKLKNQLDEVGLSFESIAASVHALKRADKALVAVADGAYKSCVSAGQGVGQGDGVEFCLDISILDYPEEISLRVLERLILNINPNPLAPRTSKRTALLEKMARGELKFTLGGVIFQKIKSKNAYLVSKE